jgi:nucleotide-binding universal stress UspA family protein
MNKIESILLATDFSEDAGRALQRAALVASEHDAHLKLFHVIQPSPIARACEWLAPSTEMRVAEAEAKLANLGLHTAAVHGIAVSLEVRVGNALDEVLRAAEASIWSFSERAA